MDMYHQQTNDASSHVFLMAEDCPSDAELITQMLYQAFGDSYSVVCVDRFAKVVEAMENGSFEVLILDMGLPDRSGVENIREVRSLYPNLPIVVLTGHEDIETAVDALQKGAQDYLTKNEITPEVLSRSLFYAKERKQIEIKLKQALEDSAYRNVQLEAMVRHDPLTQLPNRIFFHDSARKILHRAERFQKQVGLLFFDLDGFKRVNDTYGHLVGDSLLIGVAGRLENIARDSDLLARLSGDEFVIITDLIEHREQIYPLVKRLTKSFAKPFSIERHEITVTPSIGVAFYPNANSVDLLIKHADCAMYEAKKSEEKVVCFYTEEIASRFARSQTVELELSNALAQRELTTAFQPIVSASNPDKILLEALIRWTSPVLGIVSPAEFIPLAETTPVINGITKCVVTDSMELYRSLGEDLHRLDKIAINISSTQLATPNFANQFQRWLAECKLPADKISLELTEHQILHNSELCIKQLNIFRSLGMSIAIDDFGTGYSSITHLLDLPLDILKLDRALIDNIDNNPRNQAITAGIVEMAHRLNMKVIAEGIERPEEYEIALELGCDYLQGYLIAKPMFLKQLTDFYNT